MRFRLRQHFLFSFLLLAVLPGFSQDLGLIEYRNDTLYRGGNAVAAASILSKKIICNYPSQDERYRLNKFFKQKLKAKYPGCKHSA